MKSETRRSEESRRLSLQMRDLQAAIDRRAGAATRAAIADCLARAERLRDEQAKLTIEVHKLRASRDMYANYIALKSKADLTEAERGELAGLNRLLANVTLDDAIDYRNYMTRTMQSRGSLKAGKEFQRLFFELKAAWLRFTLPCLSWGEVRVQFRDWLKVQQLETQQRQLSLQEVSLGNLLPRGDAAREAFLADWGAASIARQSQQFFRAEGERGEFEIAAWASRGDGVGTTAISIGVDGAMRLKITGTDKIRISSPDVKSFARIDADMAASIRARRRDGTAEIMPLPRLTVPFIEMPLQKNSKMASVGLNLDEGVEVDLRELKTQNQFLAGTGPARYIFSDSTNRTLNRLTLTGHESEKPTIISIPSSLKLEAGKTAFLNAGDLILRLDCTVMARLDVGKPNIDIELRETGKQSLRIAVIRKGKPLFADAKALLDRLDAAKKELVTLAPESGSLP